MKKNKIIQTIAISLFLATGSSFIVPAISASATEVKTAYNEGTSITYSEFRNAKQVEFLNENTILIDGKAYNYNDVANVLCEGLLGPEKPTTRNGYTIAAKRAVRWIIANWSRIERKIPDGAKKYFRIDSFLKAADKFLGISDGIEDFLHSCFREMGMPESVNWAVTNVIMLLSPL